MHQWTSPGMYTQYILTITEFFRLLATINCGNLTQVMFCSRALALISL